MGRLASVLFVALGFSVAATSAHADPDGIPCGVIMHHQLEAIAEENGGNLPADVRDAYERLTADIPESAGDDDDLVCEAAREFTEFLGNR